MRKLAKRFSSGRWYGIACLLGLVFLGIFSSLKHKVSSDEFILAIMATGTLFLAPIQLSFKRRGEVRRLRHDIKSPLLALSVLCQKRGELGRSSPPQYREALMYRIGKRIEDILGDYFEELASPWNVKRKRKQFVVFSLDILVTEMLEEKRWALIEASSKNCIEMRFYQKGLYSKICPLEFKRVISNLIDNALEAGGECSLVRINGEKKGKWNIITVEDRGPGIPPTVLEKIGRVRISTKRPLEGGVGLYEAFRFIESLGGKIEIRTKENEGTSVSLILPRGEV